MESAGADGNGHLRPPPDARPPAAPAPAEPEHGDGEAESRENVASLSSSLPKRPERTSIVPPYWQRHRGSSNASLSVPNSHGNAHASVETLARPPAIQLEDHTEPGSEQCKALWAKSVTVDDYVIVSGAAPGVGSYVVWNCTVETLDVSYFPLHINY